MVGRLGERLLTRYALSRHLLVTSYDPNTHSVKGTFQPDLVPSGWIPIGTGGASRSGISHVTGPGIGDLAVIHATENDPEAAHVGGWLHNDIDQPPKAQSGQHIIQHNPTGVNQLIHDLGHFISSPKLASGVLSQTITHFAQDLLGDASAKISHTADNGISHTANGGNISHKATTGGISQSSQSGNSQTDATQHTVNVGGGSGTAHTPENIIKNAIKNVLIQTASAAGIPGPGGLTIANALKVAGVPLPVAGPLAAAMNTVMSSVLSGGAAAIFTNPMAAAGGILSAAAGAAATSLTSALGGAASSMVSALTGGSGLTSAVTSLAAGAASMAGVTAPTGGNFGLSDVLTHIDNASSFFGSSPPSSVDPAVVMAPLTSSPMLSTHTNTINALVASVIAGTTSVASGTAQVTAIASQVAGLVPAANAAISTLQTAAPTLSNALGVASATVSQNPNMASLGDTLSAANPTLASLAAGAAAIIAP